MFQMDVDMESSSPDRSANNSPAPLVLSSQSQLGNMQLDSQNFENLDKIYKEQMLVEATTEGKYNTIEMLLRSGVSPDAEEYNKHLFYASRNYMTPLMIAATRGYSRCLMLLIRNGADVNGKDRFDVTALHMAAEQGKYDCLRLLLDAGANCNSPTKSCKEGYKIVPYVGGTTPLHLAAANARISCVRELMQYGADYNAIDEKGQTALYIASQAGYDECVITLLHNAVGRDILSLPGFETGDTPLHFAVKRGMINSVRELLYLGSDVNHINAAGYSPLHLCVTTTLCEPGVALDMLKLLILNGYNTDVNQLDSVDLTPLHYVSFNAAAVLNRRPEMARFLIAHGANINISNHQGLNLIQFEYNSSDSDTTILKAIIESMNIPPSSRVLKDVDFSAASDVSPNNMMAFYSMWMALRRGLNPMHPLFNPETLHQNQQRENTVSKQTADKQEWYHKITSSPPTLQHFCRYVIRSSVGYKNLRSIRNLRLPTKIKSYLLLETEVYV